MAWRTDGLQRPEALPRDTRWQLSVYIRDSLRLVPWYTSIILFLTFAVNCTHGGHILMPYTHHVGTPSHQMVLSTITRGLVKGTHNVTLLANNIRGTHGFPNGSYSQVIFYTATYDNNEVNTLMEKLKDAAFEPDSIISILPILSKLLTSQFGNCRDLWNNENVLLKLKQSKFDLVITFPFSACGVLLAHYLRVPFVVVSPSIRIPLFHEGFYGMPYPSSYVPFNVFGLLTDEMSFCERMQNLITSYTGDMMAHYFHSRFHEIQVQFNIQPDKSIKELYADLSLVLSHVNEGSDFPRPRTPNYIPIGGLVARPAEPLPQDLEDFIQGSGDNGVIIFTLGSAVKGVGRRDLFEVFAKVFSRLPQRVLWRYDGKPPTDVGNNTKLAEWLPQNDILGHPKTRLLIYHGGSNGVTEAIYHAVPMVIIPLIGDQYAHAARIQKKGMGLMLDKTNITEESLMEVIQTVLGNPSFKERSMHYSKIHHDAPMTPLERSIYWMEHVMKFGADHLRPRSAHMSSIELYMVDVTLFLILVCLIGLYVDYVILKTVYGCCCKRKSDRKRKSKGE